jgi:hypothetical protein
MHSQLQQQQQQQQPPPASAPTNPNVAAAEDTNDMLYKALMQHKRMEQQRVSSLMSDTRTISEAILRKQREAQQAKLVVSATAQYATNAKYVQINIGKHPRIQVFSGMHPLSPDECDVHASLVESCPSATVTIMHNHCMSEQGMVEGFRFTLDPKSNNQYLPLNRRMFFRHSMVECYPSSSSSAAAFTDGLTSSPLSPSHQTSSQEDRTILSLLLRQNEVKDKLVSILQRIYQVGGACSSRCVW